MTRTATALYFAYGSNMSPERITRRCPSAKLERAATLRDWRLAFTGWSAGWAGGVATILPERGASAPGAVYRISLADLHRLDKYEGAPWCYQRIEVLVGGTPVWAYVKNDTAPCSPSSEYFYAIRDGYAAMRHDEGLLWSAFSESVATDDGSFRRLGQRRRRVFVYGSLRSGHYNHGVMKRAGGRLVAAGARTARRYLMVDLGAFPAVIDDPGAAGTTEIVGDVYSVDDDGLEALDHLEGHPGFYRRRLIGFRDTGGLAWCYMIPADRAQRGGDRYSRAVSSGDWSKR